MMSKYTFIVELTKGKLPVAREKLRRSQKQATDHEVDGRLVAT